MDFFLEVLQGLAWGIADKAFEFGPTYDDHAVAQQV